MIFTVMIVGLILLSALLTVYSIKRLVEAIRDKPQTEERTFILTTRTIETSCHLVGVVCIFCKLFGRIDAPWMYVLAPFWGSFLLTLSVLVALLTYCYHKARNEVRREDRDRRPGHWEAIGDGKYRCSECGMEFVLPDGTPKANRYDYCPLCGADLRGGEEDE